MRKTIVTLVALAVCTLAVAQRHDELRVETRYLSNGLKVIMAPEHSEPKIYGAVIVHAGSKNEDPSATGVAHYFEHIMFKGTDRIGTTNWEKEEPYLDSISRLYDALQLTQDAERRQRIQSEINRLNIEASKYAIANETDAILQQMGCTGLNAYTNYDVTCYHNTLPNNQLENWMEVYAERFRNPVYRLFQGELEAVYEERNIYANEAMYTFQRNLFTESFGEHPYSRDIIGLDEHLKNPQPSAMKKFYDKYYVASNMTLLLVGDFNPQEAFAMAEKYFSIWPKGEPVKEPTYQLPTFDTQKIKNVKQTPIRVGLMIFPGVKSNDRDELALNVMSNILGGENGLMAKLASEGKLLAAELMPLTLQDAGTNVILYVPKLLGQKHEAAEELIWAAIDSIKSGAFSDKLLESLKMRNLIWRKQAIESYSSIASLLESLETSGSSYEQWQADTKRLQALTKEDIIDVAHRYFNRERCTLVRSSMGFPDKESAIKPEWDHLDAQNSGSQTDFAKHIAARKVEEIHPQVVDIKKDVAITELTKYCKLYSTTNPKNDLFNLTLAYHYGNLDNHNAEVAASYFNSIGAGEMGPEEYRIEMQSLGGEFTVWAEDDFSFISISGLECNMDKIVRLAMLKFHKPNHDQQQLKNLIEGLQSTKEMAKDDASTWSDALRSYVLLGEKSGYLDHTTIKEMKKLKGEDLMQILNNMFGRDGYITYVGNSRLEQIKALLEEFQLVRKEVTRMPLRVRPLKSQSANTIYYANNSKFLKSDITLYIPSTDFEYRKDRAAMRLFNEYMGGGMNSVFFQEIREFRALGYNTYGYFSYDRFNRRPGVYMGYLGTQCDKTNDGIEAMRNLMLQFPEREEKFQSTKDYLISVRNSNYITFRQLPSTVRYWLEEEQVNSDPRQQLTDEIRNTSYDDLRDFHRKYIEGRPMVITISGNSKKYNLKDLEKYGTVKQVKYKKMIKF